MDRQTSSTFNRIVGFSSHQGEGGESLGVFSQDVTFPLALGTGDISRNCTEEGWSEPFPHYYDACGFDENETESDNQVGINLIIKNK